MFVLSWCWFVRVAASHIVEIPPFESLWVLVCYVCLCVCVCVCLLVIVFMFLLCVFACVVPVHVHVIVGLCLLSCAIQMCSCLPVDMLCVWWLALFCLWFACVCLIVLVHCVALCLGLQTHGDVHVWLVVCLSWAFNIVLLLLLCNANPGLAQLSNCTAMDFKLVTLQCQTNSGMQVLELKGNGPQTCQTQS